MELVGAPILETPSPLLFDYHVNLTILDEGLWGQRLPKVSKNLGQLLHASNIHQYLET